jgi:ACS family tartrate transporter-like MFS transporter
VTAGEEIRLMDESQIFAKCARRIVPFTMLLYLVNYIDRVNVGFAALTMNKDVGLSPEVFGFGASIFFIGYMAFQVPASVLLERFGARRWVFTILGLWGLISSANALIQGPYSYYGLRFILGVAEAGFFPGMLLYLTYWFPQSYRGRFIALFMFAIPLSNIVGAPISGFVLEMDGVWGLHGWQWMFLLEGIPATLLAFVALKLMPDRPASASWLSPEEKAAIASRLGAERPEHHDLWPALVDPRVWAIGLVLLGNQFGLYGIQLWLPQIVQSMGFANLTTTFIVSACFIAAGAGMIVWARHSDLAKERIWHVALPLVFGAGGLIVASLAQSPGVVLVALAFALLGTLAYNGPFFSLPSTFLAGTAAAGGIGLINMIGSWGRVFGPLAVGVLKQENGTYASGMLALAIAMMVAAAVVIALGRMLGLRKPAREAPAAR